MDLMEGRAHSFRRFQPIAAGKVQQIGAVHGNGAPGGGCSASLYYSSDTVATFSPLQQPLSLYFLAHLRRFAQSVVLEAEPRALVYGREVLNLQPQRPSLKPWARTQHDYPYIRKELN